MKRTTYLMIWTVAAAALALSACSREADSITGPSAATDTRLTERQLTGAATEAPLAPDTVFVSVNANHSISIAFEDRADNEDGFVVYYIQIDTSAASPGYGPLQQMLLPAFEPNANEVHWVTADITGLESGYVYKVWVEAFNSAGAAQSARAIGGTKFDEEEEDDDRLIVQRERDVYRATADAT